MTIDIDGLRKRLTEGELSFDEDFQQLEGHFRSSGDMVGFFQVLLDILDNGVAGSTVGRIRDALPNMLERWARDERGKAVKGQITQRVATLREACGDHDKAVDAWARAFRDYPDERAIQSLVGVSSTVGDPDLMLDALQLQFDTLSDDTARAAAARKMAARYMACEQMSQAETSCRAVLALIPDDPEASTLLAEIEEIRGARQSVVDALRKDVHDASDERVRATANMALAETLLGDLDTAEEGIQALESAFQGNPSDRQIATVLMEQYAQVERWDSILDRAPEWLQAVDPADQFDVHLVIGSILATGPETMRSPAADQLFAAQSLKPADPHTVDGLDRLMTLEGRYSELAEILQAARRNSRVRDDERRWLVREAVIRWQHTGEIDEAEKMFRRIRATDPRSLDALAFYEDYLERNKDWKRLHAVLSQKLMLVPESERVDVAIRMADLAETSMGNVDKAIDAYKRVLTEVPEDDRAIEKLTVLYEKSGKWHALIEFLNGQIRRLDDGATEEKTALLFQIIEIYQDPARLPVEEMVIQTYNRIVQESPTNARALDNLAERYEDAHRWSELVQVLRKKIATCVDEDELLDLYLQVADLYVSKMSNENQAIPFLELILELDPQNLQVVRTLRHIYKGKHNLERLCVTYEAELQLLGGMDREPLLTELATLTAEKLYRYDDAIEHLRELVSLNPRNERAHKMLERLFTQTERWADYVDLLEERLSISRTKRKKVEILQRLGELHFDKLGSSDRAADVYNQILSLNPQHSAAGDSLKAIHIAHQDWGALKQFYSELEDWDGYIQILDDSLAQQEDGTVRAEIQCEVARVYVHWLDDAPAAIGRLETVLAEDGENLEVARLLEAHYGMGEDRDKHIAILDRIANITLDSDERKRTLEHGIAILEQHERYSEAFDWACRLGEQDIEQGRFEQGFQLERFAQEADRFGALADWYAEVSDRVSDDTIRCDILRRHGEILHDRLDRNVEAIEVYETLSHLVANDLAPLRALEELVYVEQDWTRFEQVLWRQIDLVQSGKGEEREVLLRGAYLKIAQLHEDLLDDRDQAVACYRSVLDLLPADSAALEGLDRIYRADERWADLLELYRSGLEQALDVDQQIAHRLRIAAVLEEHLDDVDGAIDEYALVLDSVADHEETVKRLEALFDSSRGAPRVGNLLEPILRTSARHERLAAVLANRLDGCSAPADRKDLLVELAHIYEELLESPESAFRHVYERVALDPSSGEARGELERLAGSLDRWSDVAGLYRSVLGLDETDEGPFQVGGTVTQVTDAVEECGIARRLGQLYEAQLNDPRHAVDCYRRALLYDPSDVEIVESLERLYARLEDWESLLDIVRTKLDLTWDTEEKKVLHVEICTLLRDELGRLEETIPHYNSILELDEQNVTVIGELETLYRQFARWEPLVELLGRRISLVDTDTERAEILYQTGLICRDQLGDYQRAVDAFSTLLAQDTQRRNAVDALHEILGRTDVDDMEGVSLRVADVIEPWYREHGEWDSEVEVLRVRLELTEDDSSRATHLRTIANRYEGTGTEHEREAFDHYLLAFRLEPGNGEGEAGLERMSRALGAWKTWADALQGAAESDDHVVAIPLLLKVGDIAAEHLDDSPRSIACYERVVEMDPANEGALDALNLLYKMSGAPERRVHVLEKLAEVTSDESRRRSCLFDAGLVHLDLGALPEAVEAFSYVHKHGDPAVEPIARQAMDHLEELYAQTEHWHPLVELLLQKAEIASGDVASIGYLRSAADIQENRLDNLESAADLYEKIRAKDPIDLGAIDALQRVLPATERWDDLEMVLLDVRTRDVSEERAIDSNFQLGRLYEEQLNRLSDAVDHYESVLDRQSNHVGAIDALMRAMEDLEHGLRAARVLARVHEAQDDVERLVAVLQCQLERWPDDVDASALQIKLASLYRHQLQDADRAFECLSEATRLNWRQPPELRSMLVTLVSETGRWDDLNALERDVLGNLADRSDRLALLVDMVRVARSQQQNLERAETLILEVLDEEPGHQDALEDLCSLYQETGRLADKIEVLRRQADHSTDPEQRVAILYSVADSQQADVQDLDGACDTYEQILSVNPAEWDAYIRLQALLEMQSNWEGVLGVLERRLSQLSESSEIQSLRREIIEVVYAKLGDVDRTLDLVALLLDTEPTDATARRVLEALHEEGLASQRVLEFLLPLYEEQEDWQALIDVCRAHVDQTGEPEEQRRALEKVHSVQVSYLNDAGGAFETLQAIVTIAPEDTEGWNRLEEAAEAAGRHDDLVSFLESQVDELSDPSIGAVLATRIARMYEQTLQNIGDARRLYHVALSLDSASTVAFDELTRIYTEIEGWQPLVDLVLGAADAAMNTEDRCAHWFEVVRLQQDHLGDLEAASETLLRILDEAPSDPKPYELLEELYRRQTRWDDLERLYERWLEMLTSTEDRLEIHFRLAQLLLHERANHMESLEAFRNILADDPTHGQTIQRLTELLTEVDLPGLDIVPFQATVADILTGVLPNLEEKGGWEQWATIHRAQLAGCEEISVQSELHGKLAKLYEQEAGDIATAFAEYGQAYLLSLGDESLEQKLEELGRDHGMMAELAAVYERSLASDDTNTDDELRILLRLAAINADDLHKSSVAAEWYERVLNVDAGHDTALTALERHYAHTEQWEHMARILRSRLEVTEGSQSRVEVFYRLADVHEQLNQSEDAIQALTDALVLTPSDTGIRTRLQTTAHHANRHDLLANAYRVILENAVDVDVVRDINGLLAQLCEEHLGLLDEAVERYREVLAYDELNTTASAGVRRLLERLERWNELADALRLEMGQAASGSVWQAQLRLAQILEGHCDDPEGAIELYKQVLWEEPENEDARLALMGIADKEPFLRTPVVEILTPILQRSNRWDEVIALLLSSIADEESDLVRAPVLKQIHDIYEQRVQNVEAALKFGIQAVEADIELSYMIPQLEATAERLGRWGDILKLYDVVAGTAGSDEAQANWLYKAGDIAVRRLRKPDLGEERFNQVLSIDPEHQDALNALSSLYKKQNRIDDGIRIAEMKAALPIASTEQITIYREVAQLSLSQGDTDKAISSLAKLLDLDAGDLDALSLLERTYRDVEDYERLCETMDRRAEVLGDSGDMVGLRVEMGSLRLDKLNDVPGAIEAYEEVLELEVGNSKALVALEQLYTRQNQWPDVSRILEQRVNASTRDSERETLLFRLAHVEERELSDLAAAIGHYEAVLALNPLHETAVDDLIRIYASEERWESLCDVYERKLKLVTDDSARSLVTVQLAAIQEEHLDNTERAAELLSEVLERTPEHSEALRVQARLLDRMGKHDEALTVYEQLVKVLSPSNDKIAASIALGRLHLEQGNDPAEALPHFRSALDMDETNEEASHLLKEVLKRLEHWEALADLLKVQHAAASDEQSAADLAHNLARLCRDHLQDPKGSFQWLRKGYEHRRDHRGIVEDLIVHHESQDEPDEVVRLSAWLVSYLEAKKLHGEVGDKAFKLATLYDGLGDSDKALQYYKMTLKYDSQNIANLLALGRLYVDKGNAEKALKTYHGLLLLQHEIQGVDDKKSMFLGLAKACIETGANAKAGRHLSRLLAIDPDNVEALTLQEKL